MEQLEDRVTSYNERQQLFTKEDHILVACSGGADSMALLSFLHGQGVKVSAAHVDHMLRGEESREDRRFVERTCREWGIPCYSAAIPIPAILAERGGNKQQVCREERYRFFAETMHAAGAKKLALAHHEDDQLETVLLAAVRGRLSDGAKGMPIRRPFASGELIRPFLAVSKKEIISYLSERGTPYREDPSNAEPVYTRNRLRQQVIPLLERENERLARQVTEFTEELQEQDRFFTQLAEEKVHLFMQSERDGFSVDVGKFRQEALALQKRMVLILLNYLYDMGSVTFTKQLAEQVQQAMQHTDGTVFIHLPKGGRAIRSYGRMRFTRQALPGEDNEHGQVLLGEEWTVRGNRRFRMVRLEEQEAGPGDAWYFKASETAQVILRSRQPGDRIELRGMERPKKLARLMIDEKVPLPEREEYPVVAIDGGDILLVPGIRPSVHLNRHKRPEDNWALIEQLI